MTLKSGKSALKINKDSHLIKKSSPSSSSSLSSSVTTTKPSQQRQPVIIYTHSPRIIQTHPSNFMELVQKLTGLSHSDVACKRPPPPPPAAPLKEADQDTEAASSVITTEDLDVGTEVKSSFVSLQQPPPPPPPPIINMPHYVNMFENIGPHHFLCSNKAMYNFPDPSIMF